MVSQAVENAVEQNGVLLFRSAIRAGNASLVDHVVDLLGDRVRLWRPIADLVLIHDDVEREWGLDMRPSAHRGAAFYTAQSTRRR